MRKAGCAARLAEELACDRCCALDRRKRDRVIYDQINTRVSKYYTDVEARGLFDLSGFVDVEVNTGTATVGP